MKDTKYEELTTILTDFSKRMRTTYPWRGEHTSTADRIIRLFTRTKSNKKERSEK